MIPSYTQIYNMGHKAITDLLKSEVIVEEKIDGSQFSFMNNNGTLEFRSKGKEMFVEAPEQLFAKAVEKVLASHSIFGIPQGRIFRAEYLSKPKHNVLSYDRVPANNLVIFDIDDGNEGYMSPQEKKRLANDLGFECVPVLFQGIVEDVEHFRKLLDTMSQLGGVKVEGVVIKPAKYDLFGRDKKVLMGKFVSEAFKETHQKEWKANSNVNRDIISILAAVYGTPQRWQKAIQHLRDAGEIEDSPRDIGKLMKEVPADVLKECEEEIKEKLWAWGWPQLRRTLTRGLPEWYKQSLLDKQFEAGGVAAEHHDFAETCSGLTALPEPTVPSAPHTVGTEAVNSGVETEQPALSGGSSQPLDTDLHAVPPPQALGETPSRPIAGSVPFEQDVLSQFDPADVPVKEPDYGEDVLGEKLELPRHHYDGPDGFPCSCKKPIDNPIHIPRIEANV